MATPHLLHEFISGAETPLNKWLFWNYDHHGNCWKFVRDYLVENANIPDCDVPEFGILPTDRKRMTEAGKQVEKAFVAGEPKRFAVAAQYHGRLLLHVGVVDILNDEIRVFHVMKKCNAVAQKISEFEKLAQKTIYWNYGWQR